MATNLPVLSSTLHPASVTYECTFAPTTSGPVMFAVPKPVLFLFTFDTGRSQPDPDVDLYDVTTDSSWFDQGAVEGGIAAALDVICTAVAAMLSVTKAAVQATVTIRRTWRYTPDQEGSAAPVQVTSAPVPYTEVMTYP